MSPAFEVVRAEKPEGFPALSKEIKISSSVTAYTPTKSYRNYKDTNFNTTQFVEITRNFQMDRLKALFEGKRIKILESIPHEIVPSKINFVIFNLDIKNIPDDDIIESFTHTLYKNSVSSYFLPTINMNALKSPIEKINRKGETTIKNVEDENKIIKYMHMLDLMVDITQVWNKKEIIGTIPLIAPKYVNPIIDVYLKKEIKSFSIDANLKDVFSGQNMTHLKNILFRISKVVPLSESFIYLNNPGIGHFENNYTKADDFLSLIAGIDNISEIFKRRLFRPTPPLPGVPKRPSRCKMFQNLDYRYQLFDTYGRASVHFGVDVNRDFIKNYNQEKQLEETIKIRSHIKEGTLYSHIDSKKILDEKMRKQLSELESKLSF
ncbi:MAG: hypothetical protein ABIJ47_08100 [Candidatus Bathyarchaeota archaeon]